MLGRFGAVYRKTIGVFLVLCLFFASCMGTNHFLETSLEPAKVRGETQVWFEKEWGAPASKSPRWLGGQIWTYTRIAGGTRYLFGNFDPLTCKITLKFNEEEKLTSYKYSGC